MSALRWPVYTQTEILECLRLALAASPLAQPPEANWRCRRDETPREAREPELAERRERVVA
jgi:hypothetical protein